MTNICVYASAEHSPELVHARLDAITERVPCWATYHRDTREIHITCRTEDAAFCERMVADLV
jgi:hypothetical protein